MAQDTTMKMTNTIKLNKSSSTHKKVSVGKGVIHILLMLWAMTTIYPLIWVLNNSFKDKALILQDSFSLVTEPTLANYVSAFTTINIGRAYMNSFIISGCVVLGVMFFGGLASYIIARYDFKGKGIIHGALIGALLFPAFATIVPVFMGMYKVGLLSTHLGVILPQTAGNLPFAIIIMVGFMGGIPLELEEAAVVEGCSPWKIFTKIVVPISKPAFATVSIFTFLWSYNDLFMQKTLIREEKVMPICAILDRISSQYGTDYGLMAAAVIVVVVPMLIVYLFLQKYIIKGLTAGAIKG